MPYKTSSPESLQHAQLVIDQLGIAALTIDITAAVDGYLSQVQENGDADPTRRGNVMARERMIVLFDLSAKHKALPIGTSNKTERLLDSAHWKRRLPTVAVMSQTAIGEFYLRPVDY